MGCFFTSRSGIGCLRCTGIKRKVKKVGDLARFSGKASLYADGLTARHLPTVPWETLREKKLEGVFLSFFFYEVSGARVFFRIRIKRGSFELALGFLLGHGELLFRNAPTQSFEVDLFLRSFTLDRA